MYEFAAGQTWTYRTPTGFEVSRLVIGAIAHLDDGTGRAIACCAVWHAVVTDLHGRRSAATLPFLPLSLDALVATVVSPAEPCPLPDDFASRLADWQADPKGMTVYTIPFEGSLDHLIARQMAAIIGVDPAAA